MTIHLAKFLKALAVLGGRGDASHAPQGEAEGSPLGAGAWAHAAWRGPGGGVTWQSSLLSPNTHLQYFPRSGEACLR